MKTYEEIVQTLKEHKEEIRKKYNVKAIGLFGSFARGEQRKRSDVDILVEYDELPGLLKFVELEGYLQKLIRKKVDLVEKEGIRKELKHIILSEVVYI